MNARDRHSFALITVEYISTILIVAIVVEIVLCFMLPTVRNRYLVGMIGVQLAYTIVFTVESLRARELSELSLIPFAWSEDDWANFRIVSAFRTVGAVIVFASAFAFLAIGFGFG